MWPVAIRVRLPVVGLRDLVPPRFLYPVPLGVMTSIPLGLLVILG